MNEDQNEVPDYRNPTPKAESLDDLRPVYDFSKLKRVPTNPRLRKERRLLENTVKAMREWAAEEDGIPDFAWNAYSDAVEHLTGNKPDPEEAS